jgi:hypothetical protein
LKNVQGAIYKQLCISSRLKHIAEYIKSKGSLFNELPTIPYTPGLTFDNQTIFNEYEASIIQRVLILGSYIASAKQGRTDPPPVKVEHINTYRNIFRVFNDCIPIIGLDNKFLESIKYNENDNEKKIIYVPETLGDIFFLKNRGNYGTIAEANTKQIGLGQNHFITVTGTANIPPNTDTDIPPNTDTDIPRWSDRMDYGNNKPLIIEYIVRTTKKAWEPTNNSDNS